MTQQKMNFFSNASPDLLFIVYKKLISNESNSWKKKSIIYNNYIDMRMLAIIYDQIFIVE